MYLARVKIKNFRNLKNIEVQMKQGLNVIVGENNIGKTNFLTAIRIALNSFVSFGEIAKLDREDITMDDNGHPIREPIRIDLYFSGLTDEEQAEFVEIFHYKPESPTESFASIHFEWSWPENAKRPNQRRWGGEREEADAGISEEVLQSIPATFLDALRDALLALTPGKRNRIARLLAVNAAETEKTAIEQILKTANDSLQANSLILSTETDIQAALTKATGPQMAQKTAIRASEQKFERIVSSLKLVLQHTRGTGTDQVTITEDLGSNGLGYNNLLFIATVLAELESLEKKHQVTMPLLLVEEPEAHLHPQLQVLLVDYFQTKAAENNNVQIIVTTHSPTITAEVPFSLVDVMHSNSDRKIEVADFGQISISDPDKRKIQRVIDVTRATMFFARGIILVEGITEQLLIPILAERLGKPLSERGISVVPICGVGFKTILQLFKNHGLRIPTAVITDGDPEVSIPEGSPDSWKYEEPRRTPQGGFTESATLAGIKTEVVNCPGVRVFNSSVTLEYDLAGASDNNPLVMTRAWEACHGGTPHNLNQTTLAQATNLDTKQLLIWRSVCRSSSKVGKGEFAHVLSEVLDERIGNNFVVPVVNFVTPAYIEAAINYVYGVPDAT